MSASVAVEVKERPILFSGPMVRAILEGRKTQTRRVVVQPKNISEDWKQADKASLEVIGKRWEPERYLSASFFKFDRAGSSYGQTVNTIACPYGMRGDRLWVRENFAIGSRQIGCRINEWVVQYAADKAVESLRGIEKNEQALRISNKWAGLMRPSIFMPRSFSRLSLQITNIRVERLQSITESDAAAEGMQHRDNGTDNHNRPRAGWSVNGSTEWRECLDTARYAFANGWNKLNSKRGYSWESNPWVWVIEFKNL